MVVYDNKQKSLTETLVNLRNRKKEDRRHQTLSGNYDTNYVRKKVPPNFTFL